MKKPTNKRKLKVKHIKLTPTQICALDHLVGMGGEAYAGNGMFREATARPLLSAGCIAKVPGDSGVFIKYCITEHGRGERAKAYEAREDRAAKRTGGRHVAR